MEKLIYRERDLSMLTGIPRETFRYWRAQKGVGPRWVRLGPKTIGYKAEDVREWLDSRTDDTAA